MLKSVALACLLVVGCKADKPDATTTGQTETADPTGGPKGRSGKVDLGLSHRRPSLDEGSAGSDTPTDDRDARRRDRLAEMDTNGDGVISDDERKAAMAKRAEALYKRLDTDGDGKVSLEELKNSTFRRLDPETVDANHDGNITMDELQKALELQRAQWGNGRRFGARRNQVAPDPSTPAP
jgi:EF hand domain-containing protein